jgi:hypothetical protein
VGAVEILRSKGMIVNETDTSGFRLRLSARSPCSMLSEASTLF